MKNNRLLIIIATIIVILCGITGIIINNNNKSEIISLNSKQTSAPDVINLSGSQKPTVPSATGTTTANSYKSKITIYITGEVNKSGVYTLDSGSRVIDAIKIAGGMTDKADKNKINLAKKLNDEDHIVITAIGDTTTSTDTISTTGGKVNINTATKEQLMTLSGIGSSTADKIIAYRKANGNFKSISDITKVSRIGTAEFTSIKNNITIN